MAITPDQQEKQVLRLLRIYRDAEAFGNLNIQVRGGNVVQLDFHQNMRLAVEENIIVVQGKD